MPNRDPKQQGDRAAEIERQVQRWKIQIANGVSNRTAWNQVVQQCDITIDEQLLKKLVADGILSGDEAAELLDEFGQSNRSTDDDSLKSAASELPREPHDEEAALAENESNGTLIASERTVDLIQSTNAPKLKTGKAANLDLKGRTRQESESGQDQEGQPQRLPQIGDYQIEDEIARGGMGVVYRARQKKLNRTVALKMVLTGDLAGEEEIERFKAEAEAAARLDHPAIVPIYEIGEFEGRHYFSMAYIDGPNLGKHLSDSPLNSRSAASIMQRVAEAVGFAHGEGIIHRDLKPANILIAPGLQPRVTDFGLAKQIQSDRDLTRSGAIMGTPSYMPPEQASGRIQEVGPTADVYSLGAVLYFTLTLRAPFQASSAIETLRQVIEQDPVPPRALNSAINRDLETICLKCLSKSPVHRYRDASELSDDLQRFLDGRPIVARRPTWRYYTSKFIQRYRTPIATVCLIFALAAAGIAFSFWSIQNEAKQTQAALADSERRLALNHFQLGGHQADLGLADPGLQEMVIGYKLMPDSDPLKDKFAEIINNRLSRMGPLLVHPFQIVDFAFSGDGKRLATKARTPIFTLWDLDTGQQIGEPIRMLESDAPIDWCFSFALDQTGDHLAIAGDVLAVYETKTWRRIAKLDQPASRDLFKHIEFGPSGSDVYLTNDSGAVHKWLFQENQESTVLLEPRESSGVWLDPNKNLICRYENKSLWLYSSSDGFERGLEFECSTQPKNVTFSDNGEYVGVLTPYQSYVWALEANSVARLRETALTGLAFDSQNRLILGMPSGKIGRVNLPYFQAREMAGQRAFSLPDYDLFGDSSLPVFQSLRSIEQLKGERLREVGICPRGNRLIWWRSGDTLRVQELNDSGDFGQQFVNVGRNMMAFPDVETTLDFSADSDQIYFLGELSSLLWDADSGATLVEVDHKREDSGNLRWNGKQYPELDESLTKIPPSIRRYSLNKISVAGAGKYYVGLGDADYLTSNAIGVWDRKGNRQFFEAYTQSIAQLLTARQLPRAFIVFDDRLAAAGEGWLMFLDEKDKHLKIGDEIQAACFSPDGEVLAIADGSNVISIHNSIDGKSLGVHLAQRSGINVLEFSPDGRILICGGQDGKIYLWDRKTWLSFGFPYSAPAPILYASISPDRKYLVAGFGIDYARVRFVKWELPHQDFRAPVTSVELRTRLRVSPEGDYQTLGFQEWNQLPRER